jgi:hypothetical protein
MGGDHRGVTTSDRQHSSSIVAPTKKAAHIEERKTSAIVDKTNIVAAQALDVVTAPSTRHTPVTAPKSQVETSSPHRAVGPAPRTDSSKVSPSVMPRVPDRLPALQKPSPAAEKRVKVVADTLKSRLVELLATVEGEEFLFPNKVPAKKAEREAWLASSLADIAHVIGEAKPDVAELTKDGALRTTLLQTLRPKVQDILGKAWKSAKLPTFIR